MDPPPLIEKTIGESTVNPDPVAFTFIPAGPYDGPIDRAGIVTVKEPLAVCPPSSLARTEVPLVRVGTRKLQLKAPPGPAVKLPPVQEVIVTPSKTKDVSWALGVNPVPATVTDEPTGPCPGVTMIPTVVPSKVPDATSVAPAGPAAVTTLDVPSALNVKSFPELAANEQEPDPEETVAVQSRWEVGPLTVTVASLDVNPEIEAVTVAPLGP